MCVYIYCLFARLLWKKNSVDVGQDPTRRDGDTTHKLVQFFVVPDRQLEVGKHRLVIAAMLSQGAWEEMGAEAQRGLQFTSATSTFGTKGSEDAELMREMRAEAGEVGLGTGRSCVACRGPDSRRNLTRRSARFCRPCKAPERKPTAF